MEADKNSDQFERDHIPLLRLTVWAVALTVIVAAVVLGVRQTFYAATRQQNDERAAKYNGKEMAAQQLRLRSELAGYGVVDVEKGIYRIPVARGMQQLAVDPRLAEGLPSPISKAPQD